MQIEPFEDNGIHYFAPKNKIYFLFELMTSRFLDCNFESTKNFMIRYRNISVPDIQFGLEFIEDIKEIKREFQPKLIPFWLVSGTLLGWYRQCSLIPYVYDIDFAAWIRDFDTSLIDQLTKSSVLHAVYGTPENSFQFVLMNKRLKVNLFFTYEEQSYFWYGKHTIEDGYSFKYVYPKFTLCSAELVYEKVLVPCNTELIVATEYGKNWMIPEPKGHSPLNIKDKKFWTVEQRINAFLPKLEH
ncbi:fukutin-like isoform X1 [Centruroides sculpturatus]|uniref:fukutin-like isoform X1 n=3 Tax=Centruroides sculpturatus TaxID=218467 RepID=UPI000C6D155C|nr:fukutin-like isoform X1 [Centruroides sculpturatus]XP_023237415.1 fukutin-like isoform X1 [Centruroides sculpturatus]